MPAARGYSICEKTTVHCNNSYDLRDPVPSTDFLHVINDLREDTSFCNRPFVVGGPKARFYAGVPITTPRGINIGAYCVLDDKPRDGLTKSETKLLRHMSTTVMDHLEGARAKARSKTSNQMIDGLSAFVDGASKLDGGSMGGASDKLGADMSFTRTRNPSSHKTRRTSSSSSSAYFAQESHAARDGVAPHWTRSGSSRTSPVHVAETLLDRNCQSPVTVEGHGSDVDRLGAGGETTANLRAELISPEVRQAFVRAADVLRSSVGVDGTLFFDATAASYGGLVSRLRGNMSGCVSAELGV